MNSVVKRAAAPSKETAAQHPANHGKSTRKAVGEQDEKTTLGWSLFRDPLSLLYSVGDIRQRLELKYCACIALDGLNGHPIDAGRIRDPHLRSLGAIGRLLKKWSVRDLAEVHGLPELAADSILLATMENPVWGEDDVALLRAIERMEYLQYKAERSGRTL